MCENRVLRKIFGPKRDGVTGEWRKLYDEELNDLYWFGCIVCYLDDQIVSNMLGGACSTHGERRGAYRVLVEKPEVKRPLGRRRRRWEDNIKNRSSGSGMGTWTELI